MLIVVKIIEMDENVTRILQMEEDVGPVILLNKFSVKPEDIDEFLKVFYDTTEMFKKQPRFISVQLHRGIACSTTFFNYVVWESAVHYNRHLIGRSFYQLWQNILRNTEMSPHYLKRLR